MRGFWIGVGIVSAVGIATGCDGDNKKDDMSGKPAASGAKKEMPKKEASGPYKAMKEVANAGMISGTVKFAGTPEVVMLKVIKDESACHKEDKTSPHLKVGPGGGVANAVVYLENIREGKGIEALPAGKLDQKDCEYIPHVQIHPVDKEFLIASSDPILHNVHMNFRDDDSTAVNLPFPSPTTETRKFKRPGLLYTKCDAGHIWMSAFVFAVDHPYYAVTDADGNFTLKDVPPGSYKITMWHDGFKLVETTKDAQGVPTAYVFSPDIKETKDVTVQGGGTATVSFELKG